MQSESQPGNLRSLQKFAELSSQIIFSYDVAENRIVYLNQAFEQVWKKTRQSVQNNPGLLLDSIHTSDRDYLNKAFNSITAGDIKQDIEFRIMLPDDTVRWLRLNAFLDKPEPDKTFIIGSAEDQSARKDLDEYTKKFTAKKDSVLEILAHDLSGPFNNISIASNFIAEKLKEYNNPELTELVGIIKKTSERSVRLIREFVAQEFLESTTVEIIKNRVDLVADMREIVDQYKASKDQVGKNIHLKSSVEKIYLKLDDIKFRQVINNLISNALKFTPDGGDISILLEEQQDTVLITVADNGIGIPAQYHDTLFEKFTRARRKGLKGEPSIGLGMSIIKTIVSWHGGKIWFESTENQGTSFFIALPKE